MLRNECYCQWMFFVLSKSASVFVFFKSHIFIFQAVRNRISVNAKPFRSMFFNFWNSPENCIFLCYTCIVKRAYSFIKLWNF